MHIRGHAAGTGRGPSWRAAFVVSVAALLGLCMIGTASTAAATTSMGAAVMAPSASSGQTSDAARALRTDVASLLQRYLDAYGNRFSPSERSQLLGYRREADRQLAAVVLATRRLEMAVSTRAPLAERQSRGAAAQAAWRRAKGTADSSFASARQILEPKLSFVELLTAARDYNAMMGRFDDLGAQIDAAART